MVISSSISTNFIEFARYKILQHIASISTNFYLSFIIYVNTYKYSKMSSISGNFEFLASEEIGNRDAEGEDCIPDGVERDLRRRVGPVSLAAGGRL